MHQYINCSVTCASIHRLFMKPEGVTGYVLSFITSDGDLVGPFSLLMGWVFGVSCVQNSKWASLYL